MEKFEWETPSVECLGSVPQIVLQGLAKLTAPDQDPGEPRKVPANG